MAKSTVGLWALPVAIIGIWAILREAKSFKLPSFPEWPEFPTIQFKGTQDLLDEQSQQLQTYESERVADASRIEAERASTQLAIGNYGIVDGPQGAYSGSWYNTPNKAGDSCHVMSATSRASNATRYFTGAYCRNARAAGLIQ